MIWSPDLRITVEQPHLPVLLSSTVAGAWARVRLAAACRRRTKATEQLPHSPLTVAGPCGHCTRFP